MKISIIIPVYNEANGILDLLQYLKKYADDSVADILVVDGQSVDDTVQKVREAGFECLLSPQKGRAAQMNLGARNSTGDILYFVHADTTPPETYAVDIIKAVRDGAESGCYRFRFASEAWPLKVNSWFTRFDFLFCRGGDQTLFIKKDVFESLNGFKDYQIMEDFELISRLRKRNTFRIFHSEVTVSHRKYVHNGYLKVNFINLVTFLMFYFGASQKTMIHAYKNLIAETRFA